MGGGGSPSTNTTTTSTSVSNPWSGVQRYLVEAAGAGRGLANQPYSQFPYTWQTGVPLLNTALQYQTGSLTDLQGTLDQPAFKYGGAGYEGSTDIYPYSGVHSPYTSYSPYTSGVGIPPMSVGGDPYTGGGGYGISGGGGGGYGPYGSGSPYSVGGQGYSIYNAPNEYIGGMPGYYQNFATGQTMPYSNYLPYVSEVSPLNQLQNLGLQQTAAIAAAGDPLAAGATQMLSDTLGGKYLYPQSNPFLQATYQAAADPVMNNYLNAVYPGIRSAASQAGQFGSSSDALLQGQAQYNLGKTLGDLGTGIYGQNYQAERANQLKGALEAPAISAEAFTYPQALVGAGTIYQQQAQQELSDMVSQWAQKVNYPWQMVQNYGATIAGLPISGGSTTGTTSAKGINPYYVSPAQQGLGMASSLGGMGMGLAGLLSILL